MERRKKGFILIGIIFVMLAAAPLALKTLQGRGLGFLVRIFFITILLYLILQTMNYLRPEK